MMNMSKNLFTLNPKKFVSNFRVSIQLRYQGRDKVMIWGVNVLDKNEKSDGVLIKFLESEDFKVHQTMQKIVSTIEWREEIEVENLVNRKSESGFQVYGVDYKDQPVCYVTLSDWCDDNMNMLSIFGCWVQLLERAVRTLTFSKTHSTVFRIVDVSQSSKAQQRSIFHAFQITDQYYPNIVKDEIYIRGFFNIPRCIRKRSPCVFKSVAHREIFKYVPIVHVPVEYGGIPPIVQDKSYETIARHIDISSSSSRQDVVFYCYKESEMTLRVKITEWDDVLYGVNFFGESTQQTYWALKRVYWSKKAYDEFKIKNLQEDGILFLSVYNNSLFSKKTLVYLLTWFSSQGSLKEIKIEKGKGKEGLNDLQGLQKKAIQIYNRVKVVEPDAIYKYT